ncbi:hypothetical protein MTQ13_08005 [Streptomyces sp. XM4011]|uniref:hypothetical protein n=1 Tax=Streptomyces TaxID=1883 RepID=UPI001FFB0C3D|nr:hypothetical protein [Streptomyces sp. XM4011]MCK1814221.1 hypothetical protein [Streptomyces sp. XM4011]
MGPLARTRALLGTTAALALLTACSSGGEDTATDSAPPATAEEQTPEVPQGAITEAQALEVITAYSQANNQAYRDLDASLLEEIEGGSLLQRSLADLEQYLGRPEADREPIEDWEYINPKVFIPAGETWWMAQASEAPDAGGLRLLTFAQGEGESWLLVSVVPLMEELPAIAIDEHGLAQAAPADDPAGALLPQDAAAAYGDLWETGGEGPGVPLITTGGGQEILERRSTEDPLLDASYTATTPEHEHTWALRTEDGGTVVVATVAHSETLTAATGEVVPGEPSAHYNPTPRNPLITHHTGEIAVSIPAAADPQVLGDRWHLIGAG